MFVLIVGGGRTGTQLASLLLAQGQHVHLVDDRRDILSRVHRELPTESIFEGNPMDPQILEHAGIRDAQVLAAVSSQDEINLTLCFMGREKYNVPRTIARVNNPRNAWLFDEKFHVDVPVNQAELMAGMIEEEMSMGDMLTLLRFRRGNYSLVEGKIPPGARVLGVPIKDLPLPQHCVIAAIMRNGEAIVPRGVTVFEVGDDVLAITDEEGADQLGELFAFPRQPVK